jgi:translocation and assembly module TamB
MALLILLIIGAVNLPFVHTFLTKKTNTILAEKGIPIHVGKLTLLINGKIGLKQLEIISNNSDTIIYAGKASVDVRPLPLLKKRVVVRNINLENVVANIIFDEQTGELNIISLISKNESDETIVLKDTKTTTQTGVNWEIQVGDIELKNIRFIYSDPQSGILVEQNLEKAKIEFDYFSLLNEQIDVENIEITKPEGMVAIWETTNISEEETDSETTWKFSLKNLEISNLLFELDQPDAGQSMKFSLNEGQVSLEKLDLATQEILVEKIKLNKPLVTILTSEQNSTPATIDEEPTDFSLPKIPWIIQLKKAEIENGFFTTSSANNIPDASTDKWLPVNGLNASFSNILLTPSVYQLNLEKLSFSLAETVEIESGNLSFSSDSLENLELKAYFSAIINENKTWPAKKTKMEFITDITGSTADIDIHKMSFQSSNGLQFNLSGQITQLMKMPESGVNLKFNSNAIARSQLAPVVRIFSPGTELPRFQPVSISGSIKNSIMNPVLALKVNSKSGRIEANGNYSVKKTSGSLQASFTQILLSELMGETLPENISGKILLKGGFAGSNLPEGEVVVQIDSVRYKNKTTRNIMAQIEVAENEADVTILASDSAVNLDFTGHFAMNKSKGYSGNISGLFDVDLFAMNLMTEPFAGRGNIDVDFDYSKPVILASAGLKNFIVSNKKDTIEIGDIQFNLNARDSLITSDFKSGFLNAEFNSRASISDFKTAFESTQIENIINLDSSSFLQIGAIQNLENFKLEAKIHHDPVFNLFFPDTVLNFSDINIEIGKTDNNNVMQGKIISEWINYNEIKSYNPQITALIKNDRLTFEFKHDSLIGKQVKLGKVGLNAEVLPSTISGNFSVADNADSLLHQIGIEAVRENDLIILRSNKSNWIINRNPWILSPAEFLTWDKQSKTLVAGLDMQFKEHFIGLKGKNTDMIGFEIKNLELKNLVIPGITGFLPDGTIDVSVVYTKTENHNIELKMQMHQMKWENINFKLLTATGNLVADSTGILSSRLIISADDSLSLQVEMTSNNAEDEFHIKSIFRNLHFQLFEPFIDEYAKHLHGKSDGNIDLNIKSDKMTINGEIGFNDFGLKVIPLEAWLTIPDNKIEISENRFIFNNFTVIDSLKRPLTVNGKIVFENSENIWADLLVKTDKILLMNTSESDNSSFFGSVMVNSVLSINGSVFSPSIKGNIELENGTNLTYQLTQDLSLQETQNDVIFASITDSLLVIYPESETQQKTTKMPDIETTISINPKSIFNVRISDIYGVDIRIEGEGLLNYNMLPNNTMSLNGIYEIKTGECKLKITGWPVKEFKITSGSMLQWDGSIENPALNLEATTRVKGSYLNPIDNKSRAVDFIVSMQLNNKLSELEILFAIQSNDQYITSVIASLSEDEKMRQAINLLLFQTIDIPGIESSGDYISSQINSFWESQLNSLSRNTFKNTDLSFGIDTYNQSTASGNQEKTSFTYEMEHRFMNDRATVRLSGKLNDYNEGAYKSNSIFENFIFEYALDSANTKNLKLYQKRDYEDMLEGEVIKYGAGFLYRKNYSKLKDIWQRGRKTKQAKKANTGIQP